MGRGTGRRGRGRGKRGRPQKGRGHKPSPKYIGKYKKKGRNSKKTRNNYDETLLERAQNKACFSLYLPTLLLSALFYNIHKNVFMNEVLLEFFMLF